MKVQRTQVILLKGKNLKEAQYWCHLAKNLYNAANYEMRQSFISGNRKSGYEISTQFGRSNQEDFRALPCDCSQAVINLLEKNWKSFFRVIKEFKKNPKKFKGRPKLPRYKDKNGYSILIFNSKQFKIDEKGRIIFPKRKYSFDFKIFHLFSFLHSYYDAGVKGI